MNACCHPAPPGLGSHRSHSRRTDRTKLSALPLAMVSRLMNWCMLLSGWRARANLRERNTEPVFDELLDAHAMSAWYLTASGRKRIALGRLLVCLRGRGDEREDGQWQQTASP